VRRIPRRSFVERCTALGAALAAAPVRKGWVAMRNKPHVVVVTKMDLLPPGDPPPAIATHGDAPVFAVSAVTRAGLPDLLEALWTTLRAAAATN